MERLNYNQLYYFYVVASEGSIKAACEKLHLTQPTISGQLKTLEEDLGFQLFHRRYRRLELNDYGREILKRAERIFSMGDELLATLPGKNAKYRQELRIGAVSHLPRPFLHEFTSVLWTDRTVAAHLVHGDLEHLIRLLDENEIDMVLADTPFQDSKKYKPVNLGSQKLVAVSAPSLKELRKNFPTSLNRIPYLSFQTKGQTQQDIDFFLKINNIHPDRIGTVDDPSFILEAVTRGHCFSILPEKAAAGMLGERRLIKLGDMTGVNSGYWLITSAIGSRRLHLRKLINSYLLHRKKPGSA